MISLCLIAGNAEEYIARCLTSFAPVADEICIVRAIGAAEPDRTMEIALQCGRDLCVPIRVGEYKNGPAGSAWPHLDSFAAARQQSFDLATGNYIFWCDTDDVLEAGAEIAREHAARNGHPAFIFPYHIFGRGMMVPRERMVLKGSGQWLQPVHEHYDFFIKPVQAVSDPRVIVKHLPHESKTGSNERNLRILGAIPEAEMTTSLLYHHHVELALANDIPGSVAVAEKVLARPDLGKAEKHELFINLSRSAQHEKDFETEKSLLHQAYAADPCRREALALLCNNAMNTGQAEQALAYARQMRATPPPQVAEWNDRPAIYGWVGDDLYSQSLRLNGMVADAQKAYYESLQRAGGPLIALIHATRGRAEQAARCRKIWLDLAAHPDRIEHIFVMDSDDPEAGILSRFHHRVIPAGGGCVAAWNAGAFSTIAPVIVQLSDDWTPPPMWDDLILERLGDLNKQSVLAISDGHRTDDLLCMAICTRQYLTHDYFLFHPWFTGVYSDNWFTHQAQLRGEIIDARDLVFTHHHPFFENTSHVTRHTSLPDATYAAQNAPERYREGESTYQRLLSGVDWSSVPGFFNFWMFYQEIARGLKGGDTVLELGVWLGRSIIFLAQECHRLGKNVRFLAVDTFQGEKDQPAHDATVAQHGGSLKAAFLDNIQRCGVSDSITVMEGESIKVARDIKHGTLAFCFIDAAHDYSSVKSDIAAWRLKVRKGGILAGHDIQHEPVRRAVVEIFPSAKILGPVWMVTIS